MAGKETIVSTELVPADVLKNESKQLAEKAVVEITEPTNEHGQGSSLFKDALMTVVIVPVIEDNKAIGVISGGFLLNHDEWIAREYTSRIPNTYLSIGVKGVRISSNIQTDDFSRPMGSVQENELVETTSAGKRYRGKLLVKDRPALIVADPIISYGGQVVGNIGVGAPINMFEEFAGSIKTILTICLLIFVVSVFLSERASNVITHPFTSSKSWPRRWPVTILSRRLFNGKTARRR